MCVCVCLTVREGGGKGGEWEEQKEGGYENVEKDERWDTGDSNPYLTPEIKEESERGKSPTDDREKNQ